VKAIKGEWDNVQSLNIKTSNSAALPIWSCELGNSEGARWDGLELQDSDKTDRNGDDGSDQTAKAVEAKTRALQEPTARKGKKRGMDAQDAQRETSKKVKTAGSEIKSTKAESVELTKAYISQLFTVPVTYFSNRMYRRRRMTHFPKNAIRPLTKYHRP
jgi:ribosome biogenesis protein UTP30